VKVKADPEHQQDDADFGELCREANISRKSGRVRPNKHAPKQVPDDRRKADALCDQTANPCAGKAAAIVVMRSMLCKVDG
jgi:hypothetical protein